MLPFKIFTEGGDDVRFIKDFVLERFAFELETNIHIEPIGSWSSYKKDGDLKTSIRLNHDSQKDTLLILDADNDFERRQKEVMDDFRNFNVPVLLFLSPNNRHTGNLETMLCEIAVDRKILSCFEEYEACIKGYEAPVLKSKVFAYLDAVLPERNKKGNKNDLIQPVNRDYRNPAHWNLHHEYLQPLHDFLTPFFT